LLLAIAMIVQASSSSPATEHLGRLIANDGYPWRALGRLNRQGSGHCTGALVAPRVVLTAAHCLYDRRLGRWATADRIHFVAGYRSGKFAFHARAARYHTAPGYDPTHAERSPEVAGRDWAVVTLEKAAGHRASRLKDGLPILAGRLGD
jgi:protease YdgD